MALPENTSTAKATRASSCTVLRTKLNTGKACKMKVQKRRSSLMIFVFILHL
jgi:hypothetical protein